MRGLEVRDLQVRFGSTAAVEHVDLRVPEHVVTVILGPSGCGKSTLLRAIAGLEPIAGGSVRFDDVDQSGTPVHRRGFGLMFQDAQLFEHMDVAENVAYGLRRHGWPADRRTPRVAELLELVGLAGFGPRRPGTLSGGERQRVALARALAPEPRLLLLDEPLSALDLALRVRLAGELREILTATGTTTVFVTHDHEEAFTVADHVAVMRGGAIVQHGTPREVWAAPRDVDTARFLGYASVLGGTTARVLTDAFPALGRSDAVALRRDSLRADGGPLGATVARVAPGLAEQRLAVTLSDGAEVPAVAPNTPPLDVGDAVGLSLVPGTAALIGGASA
ncbi:MAG: ABC transporter ATP-binding protein [Actinobacteria bacterium]|nr:ABC transporter ATP-binding protein [Thermoleophilia bacterium]MCB9010327.1 ABC transporter ATP-binding protein [Actinomycetota bacterium]